MLLEHTKPQQTVTNYLTITIQVPPVPLSSLLIAIYYINYLSYTNVINSSNSLLCLLGVVGYHVGLILPYMTTQRV
jgi:hypothetical protein